MRWDENDDQKFDDDNKNDAAATVLQHKNNKTKNAMTM